MLTSRRVAARRPRGRRPRSAPAAGGTIRRRWLSRDTATPPTSSDCRRAGGPALSGPLDIGEGEDGFWSSLSPRMRSITSPTEHLAVALRRLVRLTDASHEKRCDRSFLAVVKGVPGCETRQLEWRVVRLGCFAYLRRRRHLRSPGGPASRVLGSVCGAGKGESDQSEVGYLAFMWNPGTLNKS